MDRLSVIKKLNKPLIERRRRERINHHIEELNRLIVQPLLRHRRSIRKLEKADILEITVEYLKMCARNRLPVTMPPSPSSDGSPPQNMDVLSAQMQQLDGLATLHHLLIENTNANNANTGTGNSSGDSSFSEHMTANAGVPNAAAFIPAFAAAAAAAAAFAAPGAPGHHHMTQASSQSTSPPSSHHLGHHHHLNFLSQSTNSEGDDENDETTTSGTTGPSPTKQRSPSTASTSSSTSGRKSVPASSDSNVGDLLMIAPNSSSSSSNSMAVAASGGSMWRPW